MNFLYRDSRINIKRYIELQVSQKTVCTLFLTLYIHNNIYDFIWQRKEKIQKHLQQAKTSAHRTILKKQSS